MNNRNVIIVVVIILLLCCCCAAIALAIALWNNGDQWFGRYLSLAVPTLLAL